MRMNSNTTVTELLSSGAFIEGSHGESLTDLISVGSNKEWIHDLPVSKLIERDAVIYLANGMSVFRSGCNIALKNDFDGSPVIEFDNSESGFRHLSEAIDRPINSHLFTIGDFHQSAVCA